MIVIMLTNQVAILNLWATVATVLTFRAANHATTGITAVPTTIGIIAIGITAVTETTTGAETTTGITA